MKLTGPRVFINFKKNTIRPINSSSISKTFFHISSQQKITICSTRGRSFHNSNYGFERIKLYDEINIRDKRSFSSFMRNVIEQVKKDMKENKEYQEALKEFKEKAEIDNMRIKVKKKITEHKEFWKNVKNKNVEALTLVYDGINKFITNAFEKNYILRNTKIASIQLYVALQEMLETSSRHFSKLMEKLDDNTTFERLDKWRKEMALKRNNIMNGIKETKEEINENCNTSLQTDIKENDESKQVEEQEEQRNELILSQESAWDKFGSKLKDMPFLNSFFENPFLGKLFGETELAASLREMKMHDKNFKLSELVYLFEYVICKHIVESYLMGDEETLKLHCGTAAFNSLSASINERKKKRVSLDTNVLIYKNHQLKGAQRMEESSPWFIFTFHTQQINCLRNQYDEIIEGKIDDIREVVYTIALSRHPEPEKEGLLYPYIIREFAIIGNTPSW